MTICLALKLTTLIITCCMPRQAMIQALYHYICSSGLGHPLISVWRSHPQTELGRRVVDRWPACCSEDHCAQGAYNWIKYRTYGQQMLVCYLLFKNILTTKAVSGRLSKMFQPTDWTSTVQLNLSKTTTPGTLKPRSLLPGGLLIQGHLTEAFLALGP